MEITTKVQIEIFHTLEKIERMNKAISFHKVINPPDEFAIEQYSEMKQQLTQQLIRLLANMDLRLQMAA